MEYLTVQEVAEWIHAEHRVVRKAIKRGELEAAYIGGKYLIRPEAVEQWFDARRVQPGPPSRRRALPPRKPTAAAKSAAELLAMRPQTEGQRSRARLRAMQEDAKKTGK